MRQTIIRTIGIGILGILILASVPQARLSAQGIESKSLARDQGLIGSWDATISIRDCVSGAEVVSFPVIRTYHQGGTMQDDAADTLIKAGQGVWRHTTGHTYYMSFRHFRLNPDGTPAGKTRIVASVEVGSGGSTFTSNATFQILDNAGNVTFTGCAVETGTRYE